MLGAIGFIVMAMILGGSLGMFIDVQSILIVFGGTLFVVLSQFTLGQFFSAGKVAGKAFMFKMSTNLPGLTKQYVFQNLLKGDYFSGSGEEHKWLVKDFRNSIIGGPSIVFHRWHERMQTTIKNIDDNYCRCALGYDANSL